MRKNVTCVTAHRNYFIISYHMLIHIIAKAYLSILYFYIIYVLYNDIKLIFIAK